MRGVIASLTIPALLIGLAGTTQAAFKYRKKLTFTAQVPAPLDAFPVLVSIQNDNDLRDHVTNVNGYDMAFFSNFTIRIPFEVESWDGATGSLLAWVLVPAVENGAEFYLYYGDAEVTTSQENRTAVWASTYGGVWHLKEAAAPFVDATSNANNSTSGTYPTQVNGIIGKGQSFNGSTNTISIPNTASINLTNNCTISVWVNLNALLDADLLEKGGNGGYAFWKNNGSLNPKGIWWGKQNGNANDWAKHAYSTTGEWVKLDGVNASGLKKLYVNGALAASGTVSSTFSNSNALVLGKGVDGFLNGILDEVRVSNTVRSANWILAEYRNQTSPSTFYTVSAEVNAGFLYQKTITIDHTKMGASCSGSLTNFPLLVSIADAQLKTVANGGRVQSASGYDIIFRDTKGWTTLDHEIESYDGTSGTLNAWVRIPSLSSSGNTIINLYYGNVEITSSIENATGVWDSNYRGVWHLKESANPFEDSTSHGLDSSSGTYPSQVDGKVSKGQSFAAASSQYFARASTSLGIGSSCTIEMWVKPSTLTSGTAYSFLSHGGWTAGGFLFNRASTDNLRFGYEGTDAWEGGSFSTTGSWSHLAVSVSSGTPQKFFVNGASTAASRSLGSGSLSASDPRTLAVGRREDSANEYFDGVLDEIRVSDVARSDCWIETCYSNMSSPSTFISVGSETGNPGTSVKLESFRARYDGRSVLLHWKTGREVDNLGFHLWREKGREPVRITPDIIAGSALVVGGGLSLEAGSSYSWIDRLESSPPPAGAESKLRYWVEDIDLDGTSVFHGPFPVEPDGSIRPLPAPTSSPLLGVRAPRKPERGVAARNVPFVRHRTAPGEPAFADAVILTVDREGWYRVTQPVLVAAGLDPGADPRRLTLTTQGQEVPLRVSGVQGGRLGPQGAIEFYATGIDTPFTDARACWLVQGPAAGKRLRRLRGGKGFTQPARSFRFPIERRDRTNYFAALRNGEAENFFGSMVRADGVDLMLRLDCLDPQPPGDALLEVFLQGVTALPHRVAVALNGTEVGEAAFAGQVPGSIAAAVPQSLLTEGDNQVTLLARGGDVDVSLVDRVRLTYWRTYAASGPALRMTATAGEVVVVSGFARSRIRVIDVTSPADYFAVGGAVLRAGEGYAVRFRAPLAGERTLVAFTDDWVRAPIEIRPHRRSRLREEGSGADLVIVAPRGFREALEPLRALREREGWTAALVDIEDVYDEFGGGEKSPGALRDFVQTARRVWRIPPRHLLLAGDATFDPRDYLGTGRMDLVPTKLVDTAHMETGSDGWFAAPGDSDPAEPDGGSASPPLVVGRLPAASEAEARAMVAKIIAAAGGDAGDAAASLGPWAKKALFIADRHDDFDFAEVVKSLQPLLPPDWSLAEVFAGRDEDPGGVIRRTIEEGVAVVLYFGHGSVEVWKGGLLDAEAAGSLANAPRCPIFLAFTCLNGFFQDVYTDSLAEALIRAPAGGASAVWASSGVTSAEEQIALAAEFLQLLFGEDRPTIGEAAARASRGALDPDVRSTWILFGDPSARLPGR